MNKLIAGLLGIIACGFLLGWRTYTDDVRIGDPNAVPGDRSVYFERGAVNNPSVRWNETGSVIELSNDGTTFNEIPQVPVPLDDITTITANRAVATTGVGVLTSSTTTAAELDFVSGVTSAIQTQIDGTVKTTGDQTVGGVKDFTSVMGIGEGTPQGAGLHIKSSDTNAFTPDASADELIVEGTNAGITIQSTKDTDTGTIAFGDEDAALQGALFYSHSADQMMMRVNNSETHSFSTNGIYGPDGQVGATSYGFKDDTNTGVFSPGNDEVGIVAGGTEILTVTTNGIEVPDGAVGTPSITFSSDDNTGVYKYANDQLGLAIGGVLTQRMSTTYSQFIHDTYFTDAASPTVYDDGEKTVGIAVDDGTTNGRAGLVIAGVRTTADEIVGQLNLANRTSTTTNKRGGMIMGKLETASDPEGIYIQMDVTTTSGAQRTALKLIPNSPDANAVAEVPILRVFAGGPTGLYVTGAGGLDCNTLCANGDGTKGFDPDSGACIQGWYDSSGAPVACGADPTPSKTCLCAGFGSN